MAESIIVIQEPASEASRYEFRVSSGVLQWRPSSAYDWRDLVNLSAIVGALPDSDGIEEGVVNLFMTAAERAKLADVALSSHEHTASDITDFESAVSAIAGGSAVGIGTAEPGAGTQGNFYIRLIDG